MLKACLAVFERAWVNSRVSAPERFSAFISAGAQSYYFDRALQEAIDDGQIRREYSVTVAMRNPT